MIELGVRVLLERGGEHANLVEVASEAERLGYDSFWLNDFLTGSKPVLHSWVTLASVASETRRIRLGHLVLCNSFWPPGTLAKMTSTLDNVSGGRFNLGIGISGWGGEQHHVAYGIPYAEPKKRLEWLKETVEGMRLLWQLEEATKPGSYFTLKGAHLNPKPQRGKIPVWIGGSGKLVIRTAAQLADVWDTGFCTLEEYRKMSEILAAECEAIGCNPKAVGRSYWSQIILFADKSEAARKKKPLMIALEEQKNRSLSSWIRDMSMEEYLNRRFIVGTAEECVATIQSYVDVGAQHFILSFPQEDEVAQMRSFAERVLPNFH